MKKKIRCYVVSKNYSKKHDETKQPRLQRDSEI